MSSFPTVKGYMLHPPLSEMPAIFHRKYHGEQVTPNGNLAFIDKGSRKRICFGLFDFWMSEKFEFFGTDGFSQESVYPFNMRKIFIHASSFHIAFTVI